MQAYWQLFINTTTDTGPLLDLALEQATIVATSIQELQKLERVSYEALKRPNPTKGSKEPPMKKHKPQLGPSIQPKEATVPQEDVNTKDPSMKKTITQLKPSIHPKEASVPQEVGTTKQPTDTKSTQVDDQEHDAMDTIDTDQDPRPPHRPPHNHHPLLLETDPLLSDYHTTLNKLPQTDYEPLEQESSVKDVVSVQSRDPEPPQIHSKLHETEATWIEVYTIILLPTLTYLHYDIRRGQCTIPYI